MSSLLLRITDAVRPSNSANRRSPSSKAYGTELLGARKPIRLSPITSGNSTTHCRIKRIRDSPIHCRRVALNVFDE